MRPYKTSDNHIIKKREEKEWGWKLNEEIIAEKFWNLSEDKNL